MGKKRDLRGFSPKEAEYLTGMGQDHHQVDSFHDEVEHHLRRLTKEKKQKDLGPSASQGWRSSPQAQSGDGGEYGETIGLP